MSNAAAVSCGLLTVTRSSNAGASLGSKTEARVVRVMHVRGTAVEHVFKLMSRSSVEKDLEAVQPKLLFCRECSRSVLSQSQPKSLREFRKHLSKSVGATY